MINTTGVLFILVIIALVSKYKKESLINPLLQISAMHIMFFGYDGSSGDRELENEIYILTCCILFLISFMVARKAVGDFTPRTIGSHNENFRKGIPFQIAIAATVALLFNYSTYLYLYDFDFQRMLYRMYAIKYDPTKPFAGPIIRSNSLILKMLLAGIFISRYVELRNSASTKYSTIAILIFWAIAIPQGTRGNIILPIMSILLAEVIFSAQTSTSLKIKNTISLLTASIIIVSTLSAVRGQDLTSEDGSLFDKVQIARESSVQYQSKTMLDYVHGTIEKYGTDKNYLGPYSLIGISTNLIPRAIWPEKPVGFGMLMAMDDGGTLEKGISYAAGYMGEGWANFGIFGGWTFSILFGALSGALGAVAINLMFGNSIIKMLYGLLFYNASTLFIRGDMLSGWAHGIYPIVFLSIMALIASIIPKKIKRTNPIQRDRQKISPTA